MNAGNPFWDKFKTTTGDLLDWLISHGFDFHAGPRRAGMFSEYPGIYDYGSTFGGNKALIATFFDKMISDYEALGGKYMLETEGYDLIYDDVTNTVTGVLARNVVDGTEYVINAKEVILATGGLAEIRIWFGISTPTASHTNSSVPARTRAKWLPLHGR